MKVSKTILLSVALLGMTFLFTGCASTQSTGKTQAVKCDSCKTVWVKTVNKDGKANVMRIQEEKKIVCDKCDKAARGEVEYNPMGEPCESCGGRLKICHIEESMMDMYTP
ncbi:MAG: hypothetical protein CMJ19_23690 [Phycisphaeraceae bacterium]|nr:hypothetical protein [Phycisphaeraceae bacterium]|tara:strand:- start:373 stop:702 length:330 start_codon:yes stop_codon:yes gene_type:complete